MKFRSTYILFAGDDCWRIVGLKGHDVIHDVRIPAAASVEDTAMAAAGKLGEIAPRGESLLLAIPSQWCLCATISTADIPRGSSAARRQAMCYRLEEKLPLAAEDLVADFLPGDSQQALGIAVEVRLLRPVIRAIESAGYVVQTIAPTALLAAQKYVQDWDSQPPAELDALLFAFNGQLEFISFSGGHPTAWDVVPLDADDAAREIALHALNYSPPMRIACAPDVPGEVMSRLREIAQIEATEMTSAPAEDAAMQTALSLALGREAWIQLRCGELGAADPYRPARRAMNVAVSAAILFCAMLCGAMLWRAHIYQRMAGQFEREQDAAYARAFDGKTPPQGLNIASRMNSEERRLRSLAGESTDVPSEPSALLLLQRLLVRLPAQSHCDLNELRINDSKLYLAGVAASHGAASSFAAALSKDASFHLDEPRTEQLPQAGAAGVSMTLSGVVVPDVQAVNGGGKR